MLLHVLLQNRVKKKEILQSFCRTFLCCICVLPSTEALQHCIWASSSVPNSPLSGTPYLSKKILFKQAPFKIIPSNRLDYFLWEIKDEATNWWPWDSVCGHSYEEMWMHIKQMYSGKFGQIILSSWFRDHFSSHLHVDVYIYYIFAYVNQQIE